ncbi:MAG: acetyl-CoA carboxylase biotin carboxyl carrier protein [Caldimonas sp.]
MSNQPFDFQDLVQLVELMKSTSHFSEFRLRAGDVELELRRGPASPAAQGGAALAATPAVASAPVHAASHALASASAPAPREPAPASADAAPARPDSRPPARRHPEGANLVKAPMVGTVYLAPEPGAQPFVAVGQAVESGTQLCIVEVMKLMNSVSAGCNGSVSEILVGDGEAVEFGQVLFVITPA